MRKLTILMTAVVLMASAGHAFAESESNSEPVPFSAEQTFVRGRAFVVDTSADAYPVLTGHASRTSAMAGLETAAGSEMVLQSANSLPVGGNAGSGFAQARPQGRSLEAGVARPQG